MKKNPDRLFNLCVQWGLRVSEPAFFSDEYVERMVDDIKRYLKLQAMSLNLDDLVCDNCDEKYPNLPELDSCPFCNHKDVSGIVSDIEVIDAYSTIDSPILNELERSKEQMLHTYLADIDMLGKKSIHALWEIGNRFMLIKQNRLHLKDNIKIGDFGKWCYARTGWHVNTVERLIRFHKTIPIDVIENAKRIQISGLLAVDKVAKLFPAKKKEILRQTVEKIGGMPNVGNSKSVSAKEATDIAKTVAHRIIYNDDNTVANPDEVGIAVLSKAYLRRPPLKNYYGRNTKSVITKLPVSFKIPYVLPEYTNKAVDELDPNSRSIEIPFVATNSVLNIELTKYGAICTIKQAGKRLLSKLIPEAQKLYESLEEACERKRNEEETKEE